MLLPKSTSSESYEAALPEFNIYIIISHREIQIPLSRIMLKFERDSRTWSIGADFFSDSQVHSNKNICPDP
jgi:hypothetical protein